MKYLYNNNLLQKWSKVFPQLGCFSRYSNTKTEMENEITKCIVINGCTVKRSESTKLLGLEIDDQHNWKAQINSLVNSLNHRTFVIRRIANQVPKKQVIKIVQCIWMSKLRYGLNICNKVRIKQDDPTNKLINSVQVAQNKMLRMMDRVSLKEHVTTKSLLKKIQPCFSQSTYCRNKTNRGLESS